jgi:hypothetical protein
MKYQPADGEEECTCRSQGQHFSEETMESLRELGAVLRDIHNDLIARGYTIKDGVITPPPDKKN